MPKRKLIYPLRQYDIGYDNKSYFVKENGKDVSDPYRIVVRGSFNQCLMVLGAVYLGDDIDCAIGVGFDRDDRISDDDY